MGTRTDEQPRAQVPEAIGSRAGSEERPEQEGGSLKCWGKNTYAMVGDGTTIDRNTPVVPRVPGTESRVAQTAMPDSIKLGVSILPWFVYRPSERRDSHNG